nr:glycosyltransferase [Salinibacter ruber]
MLTVSDKLSQISLFWGVPDGGGVAHVMITLAEEFLSRGIEVDIVVLAKEGELIEELPTDAQLYDLKADGLTESLPALTRHLSEQHPPVLLSANPYLNRVAVLARLFAKVSTSIVISEHSIRAIRSSRSKLPEWGVRRLTRWICTQADRRIAVSKGVAIAAEKFIGVRFQRFDIIYNPVVGPKTFELAEQSVDHSWFADERPPVVLGTGRLVEEKGFSTLLRAFAQVRKTRRARLVILGEGEERPVLEQQAERLGVSDHVWMPGFVSNPMKYMADAEAFVLSSKSEGLGNVLVEAMACGTPVVSTDCPGGPSEVLQGGKHGRLVPVEDPTALAMAIEEALNGQVPPAPRSALDRFRRGTVAEQYLKILASVA